MRYPTRVLTLTWLLACSCGSGDTEFVAEGWENVAVSDDVYIQSVSGSSENNVWMAGDLILRWNGQTLDIVPGQAEGLAIWTSAEDEAWIVHKEGIARWTGVGWVEEFPFERNLGCCASPAISGTTSSDIWVGYSDGLLHWDGVTWNFDDDISEAVELVSAISPDDAWVITTDGSYWHWDGTRWTRIDFFCPETPSDIWAVSATEIWTTHSVLEGTNWNCLEEYVIPGQALALHDGSLWTAHPRRVDRGRSENCAKSPSQPTWNILRRAQGTEILEPEIEGRALFSDLWISPGGTVWAVGSEIWRYRP